MPLIFVGYLALSKQLAGKEGWDSELTTILNRIDFDINNPIWEELGVVKNV